MSDVVVSIAPDPDEATNDNLCSDVAGIPPEDRDDGAWYLLDVIVSEVVD